MRPWSTQLLASAAALGGCSRCNPDEAPDPLKTEPTVSATVETTLEPEDAGPDAADADADAADAAKPKGKAAPSASLQACCAALRQNAANVAPPNNAYMLQAAAACDVAVKQGKDKASVTAIVQGALKGAGMPAACR